MTPIQRVTRYTLLLKEIESDVAKAAEAEAQLNEGSEENRAEASNLLPFLTAAKEAAHEVAEYANHMMFAGRITGFNVRFHHKRSVLNRHT